jgi:hypothetical protein
MNLGFGKANRVRYVLFLASCLAGGSASSAFADSPISACVNNSSGTIHVITKGQTCNGNETLVTLNQPTGGIQVVDANNKLIGTLIGPNAILHHVNDIDVMISANELGFSRCVNYVFGSLGCNALLLPLYFETQDCSGTAYMPLTTIPPTGLIWSNTLHYPSGSQVIAAYSLAELTNTDPPQMTCVMISNNVVTVGVETVEDLSGFTPPFRVQSQ